MGYAKVENGQIVKVGQCPQNTDRTSNFILLDDEEKKTQGWYKVIEDNSTIEEWEILVQSNYELINNDVYETKVMTSISLNDYKAKKYEILKNNTKIYVMSITPEYKQLSALAGNYPVEECNKIKAFGKAHVDAVRLSKSLLDLATTYEEVKAFNVNIKFDYETLEPVEV